MGSVEQLLGRCRIPRSPEELGATEVRLKPVAGKRDSPKLGSGDVTVGGLAMATAEELVQQAEAAYASLDIDRVMDLFNRDIVQYWDGKKRIEGWDALRQDHIEGYLQLLPDGSLGMEDFTIKKTLRMACGDMIGAEWVSSFRDRRTGEWVEEHGAEFWRIRDDRLSEWRAYSTEERSRTTGDRSRGSNTGGREIK
jgi:ketosteroid isomerase-like protein